MLLGAGSLIVCANHLAFLIQDEDITKKEQLQQQVQYSVYFYGSCFAYVVAGVYYDTLFQGKRYFTLVALNLISIVWEIVEICLVRNGPKGSFYTFMLGFNT
jgi:hypothetical protein